MIISRGGGINTLSISVLADKSGTKGLIESGYLPDKSKIGVSVTNSSGGAYDGTTYRNIPYTASGTGAGQSWSGSTIPLSMNQGTCYAYYPYNSGVTDITAVPVSTSGQDDYMYATSVTVNAEAKEATLNMNHALSAVRFLLKRGSYAGTGKVTAVSVTSAGVGTSGKLNAKTGGLTGVSGKGTAIGVNTSITLSDVAKSVDVIVVPAGTSAELTLSVTIDGKAYSSVISSASILQSRCHKYTLTVNQGELALSSVKVGNWGYSSAGSPTITAGAYTVTCEGDYEDIALYNTISSGKVIIKAVSAYGYPVKPVELNGSAKIVQEENGICRTITVSNITNNQTIIFNGCITPPPAIADTWDGLSDGIYAIRPDGKPASAELGNILCKPAMVFKEVAYQIALVNARDEDSNNDKVYWMDNRKDIPGITNYGNSLDDVYWGYLPLPNGNYHSGSAHLPSDHNLWTNGALSSVSGFEDTKALFTSQTSSGMEIPDVNTLARAIYQFREGSNNEGSNKWFAPALGQLAFMYINQTILNELLVNCCGDPFDLDFYMSTTENEDYRWMWEIDFSRGYVENCGWKSSNRCYLRLLRYL